MAPCLPRVSVGKTMFACEPGSIVVGSDSTDPTTDPLRGSVTVTDTTTTSTASPAFTTTALGSRTAEVAVVAVVVLVVVLLRLLL